MKVIVYKLKDEKVRVVIPADGANWDLVMKKDVPADAVEVLVMDSKELPDRVSRAKWAITDKKLVGG